VLAVLIARDIADLGAPDCTLEDLRNEWRTGEFDLSADAQVVQLSDGQIVGYAAIRAPGTLAVVAPEFDGRGIGARTLQWAERRERELGRERHRQWIAAENRRAQQLLCAAGYSHERSCWRMVCPLPRGTRAATMPVRCELRALDVGRDAEALHALDAASFAANPTISLSRLGRFAMSTSTHTIWTVSRAASPRMTRRSLASCLPAADERKRSAMLICLQCTRNGSAGASGARCWRRRLTALPRQGFGKRGSASPPITRER